MSDCRCDADRDTARVLRHIAVWHGLTDTDRADLTRVSDLLHRIADDALAAPTSRRHDQAADHTTETR